MTYSPSGENLTAEVWEKLRIGIWFGAWKPSDLDRISGLTTVEGARVLSELPAQRKLGKLVSSRDVENIRRFQDISRQDWVFAYFGQSLHLGQVASNILYQDMPMFWREGEPFKVRKIRYTKCFDLDKLPESFRLLSTAGRGTIHQVGATRVLLQMLVEHDSIAQVLRAYRKLDWREWLDALGPKGWETLCLGYLIQEKDFVPTGVGIGGTLSDFDIVGKERSGARVLAQCKKTPFTHEVESKELTAYNESKNANIYLFAYNGATGFPAHVTVLTKEDIHNWFMNQPNGKAYFKLLTS